MERSERSGASADGAAGALGSAAGGRSPAPEDAGDVVEMVEAVEVIGAVDGSGSWVCLAIARREHAQANAAHAAMSMSTASAADVCSPAIVPRIA